MKLGFYNRAHLPSETMRIIDLIDAPVNHPKAKKPRIDEQFEFKKRADRFNRVFQNDSNLPFLDNTHMESKENELDPKHTDLDMMHIRQGTESSDISHLSTLEPDKIRSMDVYEQLQAPEKRHVLTNIPAFVDNSIAELTKKEIDNNPYISAKTK